MTKEQAGFKPGEKCPLCGEWHEIRFYYKEMPILICPKATVEGITLIGDTNLADELERKFRSTLRMTE